MRLPWQVSWTVWRICEDGEGDYSLEEALQDTYLYLCMEEAIGQGTAVCTKTQEWALSFIQE